MTDQPDKEKRLSRSERINIRISITQTVLAIVGIFIGSVALYAALGESEAVRKQTEASVWPRVDVTHGYVGIPGQESIDIIARNRGIGPAIVQSVRVTISGEPAKNWRDVINTVSSGGDFGISDQNIEKTVISPKEDITMLSLEEKYSSKEQTRAIRDAFRSGQLAVELCYCSVFDSCWKTHSRNPEPEQVSRCETGNPTEF